jgi:hypothetical protein
MTPAAAVSTEAAWTYRYNAATGSLAVFRNHVAHCGLVPVRSAKQDDDGARPDVAARVLARVLAGLAELSDWDLLEEAGCRTLHRHVCSEIEAEQQAAAVRIQAHYRGWRCRTGTSTGTA